MKKIYVLLLLPIFAHANNNVCKNIQNYYNVFESKVLNSCNVNEGIIVDINIPKNKSDEKLAFTMASLAFGEAKLNSNYNLIIKDNNDKKKNINWNEARKFYTIFEQTHDVRKILNDNYNAFQDVKATPVESTMATLPNDTVKPPVIINSRLPSRLPPPPPNI